MGDERRRYSRVTFSTRAKVRFHDRDFQNLETRNLSLKGVYIVGVPQASQGEICEIFLTLSGATSELFLAMKGEVIRVEADGIGLRFMEIDLDSFAHLRNILYFNSDDPDAITKEIVDDLRPLDPNKSA